MYISKNKEWQTISLYSAFNHIHYHTLSLSHTHSVKFIKSLKEWFINQYWVPCACLQERFESVCVCVRMGWEDKWCSIGNNVGKVMENVKAGDIILLQLTKEKRFVDQKTRLYFECGKESTDYPSVYFWMPAGLQHKTALFNVLRWKSASYSQCPAAHMPTPEKLVSPLFYTRSTQFKQISILYNLVFVILLLQVKSDFLKLFVWGYCLHRTVLCSQRPT